MLGVLQSSTVWLVLPSAMPLRAYSGTSVAQAQPSFLESLSSTPQSWHSLPQLLEKPTKTQSCAGTALGIAPGLVGVCGAGDTGALGLEEGATPGMTNVAQISARHQWRQRRSRRWESNCRYWSTRNDTNSTGFTNAYSTRLSRTNATWLCNTHSRWFCL